MKNALAVLLLCSCCFAQTYKPIKSKALIKCEADFAETKTALSNLWTEWDGATSKMAELEKANKALEEKNAALSKQVDDFNVAGREVIAYTQRLEVEYKSLTKVYDMMVAQLNHQSAQIEERNIRAMERIAASQEENARINRSMALFSAWQAMKPAPIPVQQIIPLPQTTRTNCVSRKVGDTTYTDCN